MRGTTASRRSPAVAGTLAAADTPVAAAAFGRSPAAADTLAAAAAFGRSPAAAGTLAAVAASGRSPAAAASGRSLVAACLVAVASGHTPEVACLHTQVRERPEQQPAPPWACCHHPCHQTDRDQRKHRSDRRHRQMQQGLPKGRRGSSCPEGACHAGRSPYSEAAGRSLEVLHPYLRERVDRAGHRGSCRAACRRRACSPA
mmetsp:Transcript_32628/g.85729  ORF Transcript_32628/g.85729 Transcript_32628/m.85729 type:complete len:201 (+) Transcript_32628:442-1044(+)